METETDTDAETKLKLKLNSTVLSAIGPQLQARTVYTIFIARSNKYSAVDAKWILKAYASNADWMALCHSGNYWKTTKVRIKSLVSSHGYHIIMCHKTIKEK